MEPTLRPPLYNPIEHGDPPAASLRPPTIGPNRARRDYMTAWRSHRAAERVFAEASMALVSYEFSHRGFLPEHMDLVGKARDAWSEWVKATKILDVMRIQFRELGGKV